ncbi:MAG: acyl-CoA dehydrogenase, partial [Bacteroidota bacterium]
KSISDASLSIVLAAAKYRDLYDTATNQEEKERYGLLLELLTPIAKTFPSEFGIESVSNGLQVLGGYGFCSEYILQQNYRDIRIFPIYEGTTGIQSLDLLARKIPMANGAALGYLVEEMKKTIGEASTTESLQKYAMQLGDAMKDVQEVLGHIQSFASKGEFERSIADATVFMEFFSRVIASWSNLEMAVFANRGLLTNDTSYSADFYEAKIHHMRYFFTYELPLIKGLKAVLLNTEFLTIPEKSKVYAS